MKKFFYFALTVLVVSSCTDPGPDFPEGEVIGYKPLYASEVDKTISMVSSRPPENTGKIFLQGSILLLNEVNEGIHFIDNTDPSNPVNLGFLVIKGSSDMSVKDDVLYVNQYRDIVALDFSDVSNVHEISRQVDAFSLSGSNQLTPPQPGYYFECTDPAKGTVIDWQLTTISNPKCYR